MGVVYAAHDDRLDRPVAIKTLRAGVTDATSRERLQREARAAARVNHPAICQLMSMHWTGRLRLKPRQLYLSIYMVDPPNFLPF